MHGSQENSVSWYIQNKSIYLICIPFLIHAFSFFPLQSTTVNIESPVSSPISIVLVGDIMIDRGVERSIEKNFKGNSTALFAHTQYIADADIAFANLEGPLSLSGKNVGSRFSFRMNPQVLDTVKDAGFDVVSFANNHVGDYGQTAFVDTLRNFEKESLLYSGAGSDYNEATSVRSITVKGVKIGFLAATDVGPDWLKATSKTPGVLLASDPKLTQHIEYAQSQVDVLIMSFHWGDEYSPSNNRQHSLAHTSIDAGADVVVGHHPHVMQNVELYKNKPIFYSMGNFIFDQYFSEHTMQGMIATLLIDPLTKEIQYKTDVSTMNSFFIPQKPTPFTPAMLVKKRFFP